MTAIEVLNATSNVSLFGMMLWKRPALPAFWLWQIASVALIFVFQFYRDTPYYPRVWWHAAMIGMLLEFSTAIELWKERFSWINGGAIALMGLHLVTKGSEHHFWRDDEIFAWQLRHMAVALNSIIGVYLTLVIYKYPKGERYALRRRKETPRSEQAQACRT